MFFSKTPLSFTPSLRGFFAAHQSSCPRLACLSGLSVGSKKSLSNPAPFGGFDLALDLVLKSSGSIVIPELSATGGTK